MTWVRLEDDFPTHRKVRRCSNSAFRVHVSGLCWSSKYLTDGHITPDDAEMIGDDLDDGRDPQTIRDAIAELVHRGMWHTAQHDCPTCITSENGGWVIHDYLDMNPSAAQVQHQRKLAAERQRRARERGTAATRTPDSESPETDESSRRDGRVTSAVSHGAVMRESRLPTPTPTPIKKESPTDSLGDRPKRGPTPTGDPAFDQFWAAYPRHEAKAGAQKAWAKAIKETDPDALIAAAERLRDRPGRENRYTPHAATWLNGQRWLDEPPPTNGHRVPLNGGRHQPYHDDPTANYHAEL